MADQVPDTAPFRSRAILFIPIGGAVLLIVIALGVAVTEARFRTRSVTTDGVIVKSGLDATPRACVALVEFTTAAGEKLTFQHKKHTSRGARPECTVGEIVPLAYDPRDPEGTVTAAGSRYAFARRYFFLGAVLLWAGLWLRKQAAAGIGSGLPGRASPSGPVVKQGRGR